MSNALSALNIFKDYKGVPAVKGISLEVKDGECFGILGPNGAGKSTLLKMIYGQVQPSSGELFVLGLNIKDQLSEIKSRIGVVPQDDGLDTDFSALENLKLFSTYFKLDSELASARSEYLLHEMKLTAHQHVHVEALSGGMKRRLVIARALLHEPQMLILDEPTTGLDPQARLWIWSYFEKLKLQKKTIILTTHYMDEAQRLCDRIAIVDHGQILDIGTSTELIEKYIGIEVVELEVGHEKNYWANQIQDKNLEFRDYENKLFIYFKTTEERQFFLKSIQNAHYILRSANLNDVFLKVAGYQIRGDA
jgi:lipooligosaccharide transport system ATP-binding protein